MSWQPLRDGLVVVGMLVVAWIAVHASGGSKTALPHAFYLPVVIAGARFGWVVATSTAVVAGIACGPLMPLDVATGADQSPTNWAIRLGFFVVVALVTGLATDRMRRAVSREHALAEERAELATARSTLLQLVSHELRTPLTILRGTLSVIGARQQELSPQAQVLMPAAGRALHRLEDLAEVVIAAVEPTPDEQRTTEVAVSRILEEAIASLRDEFDPGRVHVTISSDQLLLQTQPEPLRLALRCLVENALKFAPADTTVDVHAHVDELGVLIEVVDHGPGIPEAFTTGHLLLEQGDGSTTREHGGIGMGLYATSRLVQRLGGELTLGRVDGGGTRAAVLLPASRT